MKNWKRNTVVATVLVFVCAGIYLNWAYNQNASVADLSDTLDATQVMGENMMLSQDNSVLETSAPETNAVSDYFAQVRLSRQTTRDGATELLQETIAYGENEDTSVATAQLNTIVSNALAESDMESLIIAKGFEQCVAYMQETEISIAVSAPAEGLSATDVALISDVVTGNSDYDLTQIHVIEVK